jgi:hypothetical protein
MRRLLMTVMVAPFAAAGIRVRTELGFGVRLDAHASYDDDGGDVFERSPS